MPFLVLTEMHHREKSEEHIKVWQPNGTQIEIKAAYDATLRRVASESESESELDTDEGSQESSEESRYSDDSDEESVESADEFEEDESDDNESEIEAMFGKEAAKLASYDAHSREEAAELKRVYLNTVFKEVYLD